MSFIEMIGPFLIFFAGFALGWQADKYGIKRKFDDTIRGLGEMHNDAMAIIMGYHDAHGDLEMSLGEFNTYRGTNQHGGMHPDKGALNITADVKNRRLRAGFRTKPMNLFTGDSVSEDELAKALKKRGLTLDGRPDIADI